MAADYRQHKKRANPPSKTNLSAAEELKYYGLNACHSLLLLRPQDVVRGYVDKEKLTSYAGLLRELASRRVAYHVVAQDDLNKLTQSLHHQGICLMAKLQPNLSLQQLRTELSATERQLWVFLDGVANPYNHGAILRTCAHFGIRYVLARKTEISRWSSAACRVAEGGAERVRLVQLKEPIEELQRCQRRGFKLIAAQPEGADSLYQFQFPQKSMLILGDEETGVSREILAIVDSPLTIPGVPGMQSLNVSAAFAGILTEYQRQGGPTLTGK